jgi:hypothetical protein
VWQADQAYRAGSWGCLDMATTDVLTTPHAIAATADMALFQTARIGEEMRYRFDVPNGRYQVRLLFAETYWESSDAERQDVFLQGKRLLANLSAFDEVGHDIALVKTFAVKVTQQRLDLRLLGLSLPMHSGARICAIEIERLHSKAKG